MANYMPRSCVDQGEIKSKVNVAIFSKGEALEDPMDDSGIQALGFKA